MASSMHIENRLIGPNSNPYIVAEMSANCNGEIERIFKILDRSKSSGADAVKLQTYHADTIAIDRTDPVFIVHGGLWDGRRLYELYHETHTPCERHKPIFNCDREIEFTVYSSPFDSTGIDLLRSLGIPAYKVASPDLIDLGLMRIAAQTGKPVVMSTGVGNLEGIFEAVEGKSGGWSN